MSRNVQGLVVLLGAYAGISLLAACSAYIPKPVCPTLVPYSRTDEQTLAKELVAHTDTPMTHRAIRDYGGLRDQVRACQKGN